MKTIIMFMSIFMLIFTVISCNDIINTDPNLQKDLIHKKLSPEDSLNFLVPQELDFGSIKMGLMGTGYPSIVNSSKDKIITIYKIEEQNQTGLFEVVLKEELPINLIPGEDTQFADKIMVKFISGSFTIGMYYDTLFLNGSRKVYVPIKANIKN